MKRLKPYFALTFVLTLCGCTPPKFLTSIFTKEKSCNLQSSELCLPEEVCALSPQPTSQKATCYPRYSGPTPYLQFPFHPDQPIQCEAPAGPNKQRINTSYSLNFIPFKKTKVFAAMDGIALIFSGGTQDRENHIRILSPDGYLILYKKMASIWVENGQPVKTGTVLGEINQKMQFSIHRMTSLPWLDQLARLRSETDVEYPSIPFETQFCDPSNANECKRMRKRVDQMPCSSNETANKTVTLKADWRG